MSAGETQQNQGTIMTRRKLLSAVVMAGLNQGCAAVGLTLFGVAAGTATGTGISHSMGGVAHKTFTVPLEGLHAATLMTLKRMDVTVHGSEDTEEGRKTLAQAADREIEVGLDKLSAQTTRMSVVAKKNWLIRDRATATEIIMQVDQTLIDNPHLASIGAERPPAAGAQSN